MSSVRSTTSSPVCPALDPSFFPLKSIADVVNFFQQSLEQYVTHGIEPDLTLLSIIAGYIEFSLTTGSGLASVGGYSDVITSNVISFPVVTFELISGLYKKFQGILSVVEKPKSLHNRQATRDIIKKVSDVIWNSLIRSSYKDRAHLQNLYSYLSGNKLDCFGVALAVVAGCQLLGYKDVRLAISEDHAWVVFGNKRHETIEVTWHGKGSEDKRGQDITSGVDSGSWLYLGGLPVVCDKPMEVAAIVAAINISLSTNSDCVEVAELQQKLLWILYDMGYLKKYPMALGTLGELEEINPTENRISCDDLYQEAIKSAREYYCNHHVYPYTYRGNYYNRLLKYREAFAAWADAADVIRLYTYNCRDDEEIYKELLDIANEMIPYVMKTESSGHSARSILRDSEVFANLLRFYDGICQWEEDSLTPILHIGWAKPLVNNITKFDYDIRSQIVIKLPEDTESDPQQASPLTDCPPNNGIKKKESNEGNKHANGQNVHVEGNNNLLQRDEKISLETKRTEIPTSLADLTAACGEKILNPDFLLQGGDKPFCEQKQQLGFDNIANITDKVNEKKYTGQQLSHTDRNIDIICSDQLQSDSHNNISDQLSVANHLSYSTRNLQPHTHQIPDEDPFEFMFKRPIITLYSQKMKGLKDLLLAEKLNTHAISLQVTAQSVASKKVRGTDKMHATSNLAAVSHHHHYPNNNTNNSNITAEIMSESIGSRPKRTRRE